MRASRNLAETFWVIREKTTREYFRAIRIPLTDDVLDARRFETPGEAIHEAENLLTHGHKDMISPWQHGKHTFEIFRMRIAVELESWE